MTASGISVTVSEPEYGLQIREEGLPEDLSGAWKGDFLPGQTLLTNWNSSFAVTLTFSQPVYAAGLQIEPGQVQDLPAAFTASVTAYDGNDVLGQFSTTGVRALAEDGSAPFLGISSDTAKITALTYSVLVNTNGPSTGDLGMNYLSIETTAPVPEPATDLLVIVPIVSGILKAIPLVRKMLISQ